MPSRRELSGSDIFDFECKQARDGEEEEEPASPRSVLQPASPRRPPRPRKLQHIEIESEEYLALFRDDEVTADGYISLRTSHISPSKRFWAELRGSTMMIFRSEKVANSKVIKIKDVITILNMNEVKIELVQRGKRHNAYLTGEGCGGIKPLCIKIRSEQDLARWRRALEISVSRNIPTLDNFVVKSIVGMGGGGKVFLTIFKPTGDVYALKVISKRQAFKSRGSMKSAINERALMKHIKPHPFILGLKFSFQSNANLFLGTPFCMYGDLATFVDKQPGRRLQENVARPIAAEILLGLSHLHACGVVYRDLKPENILIGQDGHIKIADFGLSKSLRSRSSKHPRTLRTTSVCGTRDYIPPEMLARKLYSYEVDMWTFGVMMYRLLVGQFPFRGSTTAGVFRSIRRCHFHVPEFLSKAAKHLLRGLLRANNLIRLTLSDVKRHFFFSTINWDDVLHGRCGPAITNLEPVRTEEELFANFDRRRISQLTLGECLGDADGDPNIKGCIGLLARLPGFEYSQLKEPSEPCARISFSTSALLQKLDSESTEWGD